MEFFVIVSALSCVSDTFEVAVSCPSSLKSVFFVSGSVVAVCSLGLKLFSSAKSPVGDSSPCPPFGEFCGSSLLFFSAPIPSSAFPSVCSPLSPISVSTSFFKSVSTGWLSLSCST